MERGGGEEGKKRKREKGEGEKWRKGEKGKMGKRENGRRGKRDKMGEGEKGIKWEKGKRENGRKGKREKRGKGEKGKRRGKRGKFSMSPSLISTVPILFSLPAPPPQAPGFFKVIFFIPSPFSLSSLIPPSASTWNPWDALCLPG